MNKIVLSSLLAMAVAVGGAVGAHGQSGASSEPAPQNTGTPATGTQSTGAPHGRHRQADPARETKMLTKRLALTPEQAAQVQPILADRQQRIEALRSGAVTDPQAMRTQRQTIMADTKQKLDAVLTEPQRQQFAEMMAQRRHWQRGNGQAPAPGPSL